MTAQFQQQVANLRLSNSVKFLGPLAAENLSVPLSAADVFLLSTRNEGWANVLLEAMACGLPVVATDVGGNGEVVSAPSLGTIITFDNHPSLVSVIAAAFQKSWDRATICAHAEANTWDKRVTNLVKEFRALIKLPDQQCKTLRFT